MREESRQQSDSEDDDRGRSQGLSDEDRSRGGKNSARTQERDDQGRFIGSG